MQVVKTLRAEVTFSVSEYVSGQPWIVVETLRADDVPDGTLGFDLPEGTTLHEAEEIAGFMRRRLTHIAVTK
jgi:hypothetical protein